MTDEELYRRYLDGDEAGLTVLMNRYGDALTLYINGYLRDIHEAEDLMIEVFSYLLTKRPRIRDGGLKAGGPLCSLWKIWQRNRRRRL